MRLEFQSKLVEINTPLTEFNAKYRGYLEKQKSEYQQQGNLEAMLGVEEELERFDSALPDGDETVSTFPELKRLQEIYRKQLTARKKQLSPQRLALIADYKKRAADLAANWTREGKIEEAKLALAETKHLAAMEKEIEQAEATGEAMASSTAKQGPDKFAGQTAGEEMKNGPGMKLCWIPAGTFTMGSPEDESERQAEKEAQVEVTLSEGFWMGKYEVTQKEYENIAGINPASFKEVGKNAPVENVSWEDAIAFCEKLTEQEQKKGKLPKGWAFTLPTEAQWEYACRAGEKGPFSGGAPDEVAWHKGNSVGKTHEVGEMKPNAWGLHDMHGNVREWCLDQFAAELAGGENPRGPDDGSGRIGRGGSWGNDARFCRSAYRYWDQAFYRSNVLGFRCVVSPTQ
ncbi:MAG: SUMF1/EgtB/PvdO family nonheme iron enzyme [Verrucomicrobiae bacterium]|nr:SUMF1/EgtB/PvdO family nonheme iron enzyme [Verrucomicrobiae bacterium]